MKKHILFLIVLVAIVMSCQDKSLDPLQTDKVKKGTVLALRGAALDKFYWGYAPFTSMLDFRLQAAPAVADGTETFDFIGEYLSENPTSLASVDFYVVKPYTGDRIPLATVDGSQFAVGNYPKPSAAFSFKLTDMLAKLGLANTIPLPQATVDSLLKGSYAGDITIEANLNLKNGTKVLASEMVASGLYQSDQFYPAMSVTYRLDKFCAYTAGSWPSILPTTLTYAAGETNQSTGVTSYRDYVITADGAVTDRLHANNFLGKTLDIYFDMVPSTTPYNQLIKIPSQTLSNGGNFQTDPDAPDPSYYDQCAKTITLYCAYTPAGGDPTSDYTSYAIVISKN